MVKIPTKTLNCLLNTEVSEAEYPRDYLGISGGGANCLRSLQYSWRWAYKREIPNRIQRLFRYGHMIEADIIEELANYGCTLKDNQRQILSTGGHWKGHIDGIINVPEGLSFPPGEHLFDVKSHKASKFKELLAKGVPKAFPGYYDQAQGYMSHDGIPKSFMYIGINKDDSTAVCIHIEYDHARAEQLARNRMSVISSSTLLEKSSRKSDCKYCDARGVCLEDEPVQLNCRTCEKVDIVMGGKWICTELKKTLTKDEQEIACGQYKQDTGYFKDKS